MAKFTQAAIQSKESAYWGSGNYYLLLTNGGSWTEDSFTLAQILGSELVEQFGYQRRLLNVATGTWDATDKRDERTAGFTQSATGGSLQYDGAVVIKGASANANKTVTVNASTDVFTTSTAHGLVNTDRVIITSDTTQPGGTSATTVYYVIGATSTTFQLSLTSGGSAVDVTSVGAGVITARYANSTEIVIVHKFGSTQTIANGGANQVILNIAGLNSGYVVGV